MPLKCKVKYLKMSCSIYLAHSLGDLHEKQPIINEFLRPVSFEILMINIKANIMLRKWLYLERLNKKVTVWKKQMTSRGLLNFLPSFQSLIVYLLRNILVSTIKAGRRLITARYSIIYVNENDRPFFMQCFLFKCGKCLCAKFFSAANN